MITVRFNGHEEDCQELLTYIRATVANMRVAGKELVLEGLDDDNLPFEVRGDLDNTFEEFKKLDLFSRD